VGLPVIVGVWPTGRAICLEVDAVGGAIAIAAWEAGRVVGLHTRYARSGSVSIAFQVVGDGATDLVLVPGFVSHVEVAWEQPRLARFLGRLAAFSRLIMFDKRGTGMSDPVAEPPSIDERMDDIRAVMDAAGSQRATVFGISEGGTLSLLFAHAHPHRAAALITYGSWARRLPGPDYPYGRTAEQMEATLAGMSSAWDTGEWWDGGHPSADDDERHRAWWARYLRMSASPAMAQKIIRMNMGTDIRDVLPLIDAPTLILHRSADSWIDVGHARYLAEHIPGAQYVELTGTDHRPWLGDVDAIADAIERFVTGRKSRPRRHTTIGPDALSQREREVAVLACHGQTAIEIASRLYLSSRTVESYLVSIYTKLGIDSKSELIRRAAEFGF
jgi:pimeloyl-ACP methyl ester carboxylesterase/DNA-binding CsgD family transcriptional regulator